MPDIALRAVDVGKMYRLGAGARRPTTLGERLRWIGRERASDDRERRTSGVGDERLWTLRHVSFDVAHGEVVGIVGRNGAGKSTLLKILSRVTEPTAGYAEIYGRVTSLLDVGIGFHPELSGRENIYMNGAILGMKRREIRAKLDEIVAFAEIAKFVDMPVKRYSTGMYMRLAFSVAAHLEPEILIVDEVLAVGDIHFQRKCLGKMENVAQAGRTVLFVSHNMEAVQRLCSKGLLLETGRLVCAGPIRDVISRYRGTAADFEFQGFDARSRAGEGWAHVADLRLLDGQGRPVAALACDDDLCFEADLHIPNPDVASTLRGLVFELQICSYDGRPLLTVMTADDGGVELPPAPECRVRVRIPGPTLVPGRYSVNTFLGIPGVRWVDFVRDGFAFEVRPPIHPWRPYELDRAAVFCRKGDWMLDDARDETAVGGIPANRRRRDS